MLLYLAVKIFLSILFNYVLYGQRYATTQIYTIMHITYAYLKYDVSAITLKANSKRQSLIKSHWSKY